MPTRRAISVLTDGRLIELVQADRREEAVTSDDATIDSTALGRLVDQLPLKQRQVVTLFYMQEQSHEEVAAMLAMPVGTVKTLLHRARARLSAAAGRGQ